MSSFDLDVFLQRVLRRAYNRTPIYKRALYAAKRIEFVNKRKRAFFTCAECGGNMFSRGDVQVDHVVPVIDPERGFTTIADFITRLFLGRLQVLCKACHVKKSTIENRVRRIRRKKDREDYCAAD